MKRGELWTVAGGSGYAGKPRPAVILQSDKFFHTESITVCPLTTDQTDSPLLRMPIEPSEENGLLLVSNVMIDKVITVSRTKLGRYIGRLTDIEMTEAGRRVVIFLALA